MCGPRVLLLLLVAACGGSTKAAKAEPARPEAPRAGDTEADRERTRRDIAAAIVPEGSTCLPTKLKDDRTARLELAADGKEAILCAVDVDRMRLLGPIACWTIGLPEGGLTSRAAAPLPGRGLSVLLDGRCARGYCLPKQAKLASNKLAHMAWNLDRTQVAVLVGDDVHLFDAASKAHGSTFNIRGDKGVTSDPIAVHFVGDAIFVEGIDGTSSGVWVFKADGTQVGPIRALGGKDEKPLSTHRGSFSILDDTRVAIAERGMQTLTTYEIETGKRAKLVRKLAGKPQCKAAEVDAFWLGGDGVTDKCKASMDQLFGHLVGATAFAGAKSLVVLLRDVRVGELGVLDPKTLAEKDAIKLPWCEGGGAKEAKPK